MGNADEEKVLLLLQGIEENLAKEATATKGYSILKSAIIELSAPKIHGLQFKALLHDLLQKINIEIGLNGLKLDDDSQNKWDELEALYSKGLGSWAQSTTLARVLGSQQ
ncbi:hypothetical protein P7H74_09025 [Enterococcus devriesei]|uniref:hypothetical protein n=1 Tax=Enterococcus devriesei TaxID=319970 RepID=UPI001C113B07|nr:hypothetical protein [Enterococcus devriesei]MBU5365749.1 hypothetical protein [Enterococcus devriesei]MDT2821898.1 hypothetical protein [Enterococcus devriesei]